MSARNVSCKRQVVSGSAYDTSDPEGLGFGSFPGREPYPDGDAPLLPQYELIAHAQNNINMLRTYQSARWAKTGSGPELRQLFEQQVKHTPSGEAGPGGVGRAGSFSSGSVLGSNHVSRMNSSSTCSFSGSL